MLRFKRRWIDLVDFKPGSEQRLPNCQRIDETE